MEAVMEPGFTITVNGAAREVPAEPERSLLEVLREELGVTGPKLGCGEGECGACTVLLGRRAVTACTTPVSEAAGHQVTTVEGLAEDGLLHPVQQAWMETGAMQCGYCTPGCLTGTAALLARVPHPDDDRIDAELAGHVCRCCACIRQPKLGDVWEMIFGQNLSQPRSTALNGVERHRRQLLPSGTGWTVFVAATCENQRALAFGMRFCVPKST